MQPLKIAMLGAKSVPWGGGICKYVEEIGSRLVSRGHEVTVYCRVHYLNDPSCNSYRGVQRVTSPGIPGKYLDAPTHTLTAAISSISRNFDIIHVHGLAQGFVLPIIRMFSRKPTVLTVHACDWQGSKWGWLASNCMKQASRMSLKFAHQITTVSRGLQKYLLEERGYTAEYTPPGVHIPDIIPPMEILRHGIEPHRYILCVSRLVPEKGIHYVVEAFERLQTDHILVIAGDCPYKSDYVDKLKAHESDRIRFLGYVSGRLLEELYSNAYLFVQPSDLEGLSIAVIEALSYGRCVLASDIPQNIEGLGGRGYTFRAGDVDDLTTKLRWLLGQPEVVEREFTKSREYVSQEFDWERTVDVFESIYISCMEASPSAAHIAVIRNVD